MAAASLPFLFCRALWIVGMVGGRGGFECRGRVWGRLDDKHDQIMQASSSRRSRTSPSREQQLVGGSNPTARPPTDARPHDATDSWFEACAVDRSRPESAAVGPHWGRRRIVVAGLDRMMRAGGCAPLLRCSGSLGVCRGAAASIKACHHRREREQEGFNPASLAGQQLWPWSRGVCACCLGG